ncbi:hypothetical protein [Streptomyces sp. 1331.2]|uniref:hypothetical protein n=1 Tax=Streptomyces sp. 1331.2 TaxID=1938835 RepID=UPI00117E3784|nr:hypothetical protein [Streptomyces sp. 1331.2]
METQFTRLCAEFGWSGPARFRQVYAATARKLGENEEVSDRQFHRWRQPLPPCPQPGRQRVLEGMLGIPLEQAGFTVPDHRRSGIPPTPRAELEDVNRRSFLALAGGAAVSAAVPTPRIGTETVMDLRAGLASLYGLDDRFGGATVGPLAQAHLARAERLIATSSYPSTIGRQLRLIAGETAEHVAWLAFDAGDNDRARTYWHHALVRAEELQDDSLAVVVLASMALMNLREREPAQALELTRRAQDRAQAWAPPSLVSILMTREARALAMLGDHVNARSTLARATRSYEQERGARPVPDWAVFHGPAELALAQASLFTEAGHHKAAVEWLRRSLGSQESSYARNEALVRFNLAGALAQAGEAEEAAHEIASGAVLLTEVSSGRARTSMQEAHSHLQALNPALAAASTAHLIA